MITWYDYRPWCNKLMRVNCCFLVVVAGLAATLQGEEFTVQNDSLTDGQPGYAQVGFVEGDIGAAVFELPPEQLPVRIKRVQVYWRAQDDSTTQVMTHLRFYRGGAPHPGSPVGIGEGALMTAGFLNEFDVSNLDWTVETGPFTVGVEYVGDMGKPVDTQSGHMTSDGDGCQTGKNLVYDSAIGQWLDACGLGMSGDLVIRVQAEPVVIFPFPDYDGDGDVDMVDFAEFQLCYAGEGVPIPAGCRFFDCDADGDVDQIDFASFAGCASGPTVPYVPGCGECRPQTPSFSGTLFQPPILWNGLLGPEYTGVEIAIFAAMLVLLAVIVGPCWTPECREAKSNLFFAHGVNPDEAEQANINAALDWLLSLHDSEGDQASVWYDTHLARNSTITGTVRVNHWVDRERFVASQLKLVNRVVIHEEFVSGVSYSPELLGLLLFAEWQHINEEGSSPEHELYLDGKLRAFRQRNGLTDVHPEIHHGFEEGTGY